MSSGVLLAMSLFNLINRVILRNIDVLFCQCHSISLYLCTLLSLIIVFFLFPSVFTIIYAIAFYFQSVNEYRSTKAREKRNTAHPL